MYLYLWRTAALLIALLFGARASADKSAVSPTRLKLPSGPGSLTGLGENVQPNLAMGLLTYRIRVELPEGFPGATPSVDLLYNSSGANSIVGIGWDLAAPSIARRTASGLPAYTAADRFVADGSTELIDVGDSLYRARFEGDFVRYRWHERNTGASGHWTAEYPEGSVAYFGAKSNADAAPDARIEGPDGTFRYYVSEVVSALGHRIEYSYGKEEAWPVLQEVRYGFVGGQPRYTIKLDYEQRPDWLSDGKPGFLITQTSRLVGIRVLVEGQQLRRYELAYDESEAASRLAAVRWFGHDDDAGPFPVAFSFDYTGRLTGDCAASACSTPTLHRFADPLPVDFRTGDVDLIDLDGDAMPDVIDTAQSEHRLFLNRYGAGARFVELRSEHGNSRLSQPEVVMFDVDGDGYADLLDSRTRHLLINRGQGDWSAASELDSETLPDFGADANARFLELTGDGRIDVLHSDEDSTWYWENLGDGDFQLVETGVHPLGASFNDSSLQLADINGDSLLDAVLIAEQQVTTRINLGLGRWSEGWTALGNVPEDGAGDWQLADLNGDALADLVRVVADQVQYSLNINATYFSDILVISSNTELEFPERTSDVSVRFADMNGNGTTDIVWMAAGGTVSFLELFTVRPNLLSRVRNGLGLETRVEYGSSVAHQMRAEAAGTPWQERPPFPVLTVDKLSIWNEATQTEQEQHFAYRDGYYSPDERQFHGFAQVEVLTPGDAHTQASTRVIDFDVGNEDPYRRGLPIAEREFSDATELSQTAHSYGDCGVAGAEDAKAVRYVCLEHTRQILQEGVQQNEWVTVERRFSYDNYGNRTLDHRLGITQVGHAGCSPCSNDEQLGLPCGDQCLGDEHYVETAFIDPGDTDGWHLRLPHTQRSYGVPGSSVFTEKRFYYDGPALVGMAHGEATAGLLVRTAERAEGNSWVDVERVTYTAEGMVSAAWDAKDGRRSFSYSKGNLLLAETVYLDGYSLQQTVSHDSLDRIVESHAWQLQDEGDNQDSTPSAAVSYGYDTFSRVTAIARPGESVEQASERFEYVLGSPLSRIERRLSSMSTQTADVLEIDCYDSAGRRLQSRTAVGDGTYQITEHVEYSPQGSEAKLFSAYLSDRADCTPFASQPHTQQFFDAKGRILRAVSPSAEQVETPSESRTVYEPLAVRNYDQAAVAGERETPTVEIADGLGRPVVVQRFLGEGESHDVRGVYDELGRLSALIDPLGNRKRQQYDRLGRVVRVEDPDTGIDTFQYDIVGNLTARTDARGTTRRLAHDALGRVIAEWDDAEPELSRVQYQYDRATDCDECTHVAGRLASIVYPVDTSLGIDSFGYDVRGRPTYVGRLLEQTKFDFRLAYDNADRVVEKRYPGGHHVGYELDGLGRITGIPGFVEDVDYAPSGLMSALRLANGVVNEWQYDALEQLVGAQSYTTQDTWLELSYRRDRVGNIVQIDDALARAQELSFNANFEYDALHRLRRATLEPESELEEQLDYEFDAGNRLRSKSSKRPQLSAHVATYTYGGQRHSPDEPSAGPNAVTLADEVALEYDAAGHLTRRGNYEFSWDYLGRLREVRDGGQVQQRLSYGPGHDRVKNHDRAGFAYSLTPDFEVRDSVATAFVELDGRRIASMSYRLAAPTLPDLAPATLRGESIEPNPDGKVTAGDAWLSEAVLQGFLRSDMAPEAALQAESINEQTVERQLATSAQSLLTTIEPTLRYFHHDHLGSVVATTDAEGQLQALAHSYPFGQLRDQNVGWQRGDPRYTGKERDLTSGLVNFGVRLYDPSLGVWTRPDPRYGIATPEALNAGFGASNRYAFSPNPVNSKDGNGEFAQWIAGGIVGAVTGGAIEYVSQKLQGKEADWGAIGTAAALGAAEGVVTSGLAAAKNSAKLGKLLVDNKSKIVGSIRKTAEVGKQTLGKAKAAVHKVMPTSRCAGGVCPCFVGDTAVHLGDESVAIAEVELGQRVGPPSQTCAEVNFEDWEVVHLRMVVNNKGNGDELALQLLRPRGWTRGPPGGDDPQYLDVSLPELNVAGTAFVTFRGPAPQLLPGAACPVIGLVRHTAHEVVTIGLSSGEHITATPEHPLFSQSRNSWVAAAQIIPGEQLETAAGGVTVQTLERQSGAVEVFNLEVLDTHQYFVGIDAVRAHNTYGDVAGGAGAKAAEGPKFTYRGDTRDPSEIFNSGLEPQGTSTDLFRHAFDNQRPPSAYVSTSTSEFVAKGFAPNVYIVRNRKGIDVNKTLGEKSPFPDELEIAIPGSVPGSDIRAVTIGNQSILNPNYTP